MSCHARVCCKWLWKLLSPQSSSCGLGEQVDWCLASDIFENQIAWAWVWIRKNTNLAVIGINHPNKLSATATVSFSHQSALQQLIQSQCHGWHTQTWSGQDTWIVCTVPMIIATQWESSAYDAKRSFIPYNLSNVLRLCSYKDSSAHTWAS
jgi:hypothetical protein